MVLPLYSFVSGGKIAMPLALCSFVLLAALGVGLSKPRMSTLSSAMFGLLYCGVPLRALLLCCVRHALPQPLKYLQGAVRTPRRSALQSKTGSQAFVMDQYESACTVLTHSAMV